VVSSEDLENPNARHIAKRERYVVVRYPHNGEAVSNGHALFVCRRELEEVPELGE
jgi:hypothetical protein